MRSPTLLPMRMKAADTSASSAIALCTLLTSVWRSWTTALIDTFMIDVSTTSTNIAMLSSSARRGLPSEVVAASSIGPSVPPRRGAGSTMASSTTAGTEGSAGAAAKAVLVTLAAAQFVMILDSSVMNVSIATVAKDLDTTVAGIQTAITMYTLVMASLMITGGRMGQILGRKRAFAIGCVIYGCGSFVTAISPNLPVMLFGWSLLEGTGAALVLPAIVALVASNFDKPERPKAYGLVAVGGAIAVGVGPLIGGLFTTYWSWRYVFVGEVLVIGVVLLLNRRIADTPKEE